MKFNSRLLLPVLAVAASMCCGAAVAEGYDVYLLIGQSNMSGRGTLTADNALPNDGIVKFTKDMKWASADEPLHFDSKKCGAGLAMSFARMMADASPGRTVALVPCAVGGTPLERWRPGGDLYSNAVVRARAALRDGTLKGILWHQGCFDSRNPTNAATYAARLVPMVERLRDELGSPDVPFVAGELPRFLARYVKKNGHHQHWPMVNAQLAEAVSKIPHAALVSSEGLNDCKRDLIHFETPSLRRFGERYAEAMLRLQGVQTGGAADAPAKIATSQARIKPPDPNVMRTEANAPVVKNTKLEAQFVVCGGGLSGICAAIAAARRGVKVVLVQDRPMLGGNASSEMRMGIMGAYGDANKEAGILEELQLRNFYYNPLRRYTLWDDVMYSAVIGEPNITLLLNTSVDGVEMKGERIAAVKAWNSNAYTRYVIAGELFADCTGDGILRLSGAKFRHGRELPSEFGEDFQQGGGDGRTMGNSILLQLRKTKEDHPFHAPAWAYKFTDADFVNDAQPNEKGKHYSYKRLYPDNNNFWWIEFGGNFDTIGDANEIQLELKKIAYGVWDYMKNHPDGRCRGYDLDWIGSLPGKRESVRFVGPRILNQHDVMSGGHFEDVVAYGGWTLDDHHPDAFWKHGHLSEHHRCPSPFGIPFDCLYSVNVPNLMFAGRDISVTHMALSATRVMATCATIGQAVGTAAAVAFRHGGIMPADVRARHIAELQDDLEDDDCMLPFRWRKVNDLTRSAKTAPANEPLRSGIDRWTSKDTENGVWVEPGAGTMVYEWDSPRRRSGARLVFDSVMKGTTKRMMKLEAEHGRVEMPAPLARAFRVEARLGGEWKTVYADDLNILRFRKVSFDPVDADALRLVVSAAWGGGKAHVFAFDAR